MWIFIQLQLTTLSALAPTQDTNKFTGLCLNRNYAVIPLSWTAAYIVCFTYVYLFTEEGIPWPRVHGAFWGYPCLTQGVPLASGPWSFLEGTHCPSPVFFFLRYFHTRQGYPQTRHRCPFPSPARYRRTQYVVVTRDDCLVYHKT